MRPRAATAFMLLLSLALPSAAGAAVSVHLALEHESPVDGQPALESAGAPWHDHDVPSHDYDALRARSRDSVVAVLAGSIAAPALHAVPAAPCGGSWRPILVRRPRAVPLLI